MKFYYMSDLHYDINGQAIYDLEKPKDASESTLLLAGDLYSKGRSVEVAEHFAHFYKYVVWVCGNHCYYWLAIHETHKFQSDLPNVFWLENKTIDIEGIKIFGCTLWHPLDVESDVWWRYYMNDPRLIRGANWSRLRWQDINLKHEESLYTIANSNADILLTHHGLTNLSVCDKFKGKLTNKFYISEHPELLRKFKHYIHGHVHNSVEVEVEGCQVHCNPHGYNTKLVDNSILMENPTFSSLKYFEINKE
jgi:hypothetical protein